MAIATIFTFLMKSSDGSSYSKLLDIDSFPDLGSAPEQIDVTTLTDTMRHYINGVEDIGGGLEFTAFYTSADYQTLAALADTETYFSVWFGGTKSGSTVTPTGSKGKFSFKGYLSVFLNGGGVNDPVKMTITIAPSTDITFTPGTSA